MERAEFIKKCSIGCAMFFLGSSILESCTLSKHVEGEIVNDELRILKSSFLKVKDGTKVDLGSLIVQHDKLQFPICVYKNPNDQFIALLMRCPHQGAELQVFGDRLHCPAHGSEFSKTGKVLNAPAINDLRVFPTRIENEFIYILLK